MLPVLSLVNGAKLSNFLTMKLNSIVQTSIRNEMTTKIIHGKGFKIELEEEVTIRLVAVAEELLVLVLQHPILQERKDVQFVFE